jgi:hypothetical protein
MNANVVQQFVNWSKNITRSYPRVRIEDLTDSWHDGLALAAVVHWYASLGNTGPCKIDYDTLEIDSPRDWHDNLKLAIDVAEEMGVPRLLDPG